MVVHFSGESGNITRINHYLYTEVDWALCAAHGV